MLRVQNKERILKVVREMCELTYKCKPVTMMIDFSKETLRPEDHRMMYFKP
jgi:hypothetical protein